MMAFNKKNMVFKGDNGEKLSTEKSPAAAKKRVNKLHKINKPLASNRGKSAQKAEAARNKKKKKR